MENNPNPQIPHKAHIAYIFLIGSVFVILAVIFLFFPRTKYSELEKRDLASFPELGNYKENPSQLTADISQWFSDSEPFRDQFMTLSMNIREAMKYKLGNDKEAVSFIPTAESADPASDDSAEEDLVPGENPMANANAKMANAGIIIVGSGPEVTAIMAFGAGPAGGKPYIEAINEYAEAFPNVNIYAMVIPNSSEFFLPEKARNSSKPQKPVLDYIRDNENPRIKFVDVHKYLSAHLNENVFLRTDHHWSPLGAHYGAQALAKTAGVPFKGIENYDKKTIHKFVGTMYAYSKDISVKNAPEDFNYYVPKGADYKATYVTYELNKNMQMVGETQPYESSLFHPAKDGSALAYNTFMNGDRHLVNIKTNVPGNRKLLIIKDSYGNAVPSNLLFSFSEIHVVDFRYFSHNMKKYVKDNGITDLALTFNIFNACNTSSMSRVKRMLTQTEGSYSSPVTNSTTTSPAKEKSSADASSKPDKEPSKTAAPKESAPKEAPQNETPKETPPAPAAAD